MKILFFALALSQMAFGALVDCSVEAAPHIYYSIRVEEVPGLPLPVLYMSGPHMSWKGLLNSYSNPEYDEWYGAFGDKYIIIHKPYNNPAAVSLDGQVFKTCL